MSLTPFRSAFEAWPGDSANSTGSGGSWGSEQDEGGKHVRVVGFNASASPDSLLAKNRSASLMEPMKRTSSLAQQLALSDFEQLEKPKLRAINTKPSLGGRPRRMRSVSYVPLGVPGTLPSKTNGASNLQSSNSRRSTWSSTAPTAIPPLTKAWTSPDPLPEISESLRNLLAIENPLDLTAAAVVAPASSNRNLQSNLTPTATAATATLATATMARSGTSSTQPSPPPHSGVSPATEKTALSKVAVLREALRQEQDEVSRLRRELARLSAATAAATTTKKSAIQDVSIAPVTPDAENGNSKSGGGGGSGGGDGDGGGMLSPFSSSTATATAAAAAV